MEKLSSMAEAQDDLEIVSIGALYRGHWEKKYWSSSRAKDRYPYPVGYHAIRTHAGTRCQMEIREGTKGPLFLVKLTDGESCSGFTPDLAWKTFQKNSSPKAINWNGRRLSSKIDGSELFGFKNKVVQRLLRELVTDANATSSNESKQTLQAYENVQTQDNNSDSNRLVYLRKSKHIGKRSVKCKPEERLAKRLHQEGCTTINEESSDLLGGSQKEKGNKQESRIMNGDDVTVEKHVVFLENYKCSVAENMPSNAENIKGNSKIMNQDPDTDGYHASKPVQSLPEEISPLVKEDLIESMSDARLSSDSSNPSSQKTDQDSDEQEITRSMMAFLLPQAIPLLKKTYSRKSSRKKMERAGSNLAIGDKVGGQLQTGDLNCKSDYKTVGPTLLDIVGNTNLPLNNTVEEVNNIIPDSYEDNNPPVNNNNDHETNDAFKPTSIMKQDNTLNRKSDAETMGPTLSDEVENTNPPKETVHKTNDDPTLSDSKTVGPTLLDVVNNTVEEVNNIIPDNYEDNNAPVNNNNDHETNDALKPTSIMKQDNTLNHKSDAETVGPTLSDEVEEEKEIIPYSFDDNNLAKETVHKTNDDASKPISSQKEEEDKSQKDLKKGDILLTDSFLACLEEEFVKIENERVQNSTRNEVPLSDFENTALPENKITGLPLENKLEDPFGPYLHPQPVLSLTLTSKGDCLEMCVLCGTSNSFERSLYVYDVDSHAQPSFIGYTSMCFLSSEEPPFKGNLPLGRVGLQYIAEEQLLALFPSIKTPYCSKMSISCSCLICKMEQGEETCVKIVRVNFGFVSPVTKLMPHERVTCILVCNPNYVIAFEESARLHVWVMSPGWSAVSDEFTLPGSDNMCPSILELREIPRSNSLVLGHNGFGAFCLWDVTRRALLSKFMTPNNMISEILPLSCFNTSSYKSETSTSNNCLQAHLKDIVTSKGNWMMQSGDGADVAVWLLISSATVSEFQKDLKAKEPNRRWRLALLVKNSLFLGPLLDQRISVVDASTNYGFAGTLDGLFYKWNLISGRKIASIHCFESDRVSCIAVDHKSGAVAVADDKSQVLIYML